MGDMAARITPLGILAITVLDDPTTETLAAFQDAVKAPLETQIRERDERIRKLEGMLKVYASGHHDEAHVGRGAEDYTDCPEQICIDACDALGYREG